MGAARAEIHRQQLPGLHGHGRDTLNLAELQAACELRAAVRVVEALEHVDVSARPATYRQAHARDLTRARIEHVNARAALEDMFRGEG